MEHYIDLTVLPDPEISEQVLLNNVFAKFHRFSMQVAPKKIAVSFPKYRSKLGDVLRLHGTQTDLNTLMQSHWLKGVRDYCKVSAINPIPNNAQFRTVRRVQKKSNHNKRKRCIQKGWLTEAQALEKHPDTLTPIKLPFLQFNSLSSNNIMRVYIEHGPLQESACQGELNSYGLSRSATIPWF